MRRLFLSWLVMAMAAVCLLQAEISQLHILAYMQYAIVSCILFGIFLGLNNATRETEAAKIKTAVWRWRQSPALSYVALLLWLLVAVRLANLRELGVIPDGTTFFQPVTFLQPSLLHETVITAILVALFQLNVAFFRSLTIQLVNPAPESSLVSKIGASLSGMLVGLVVGATLVTNIAVGLAMVQPEESTSAYADFAEASLAVAPYPMNVLLLNCGDRNLIDRLIAAGSKTIDVVDPSPVRLVSSMAGTPSQTSTAVPVRLHFTDPRQFLTDDRNAYDLVLLDDHITPSCISPFTLSRPQDCAVNPHIFQLIYNRLKPDGYLVVQTPVSKNWHFLRVASNMQQAFGLADGFAQLASGIQLFAVSPSHANDLHTVLATASGIAASPDTIAVNQRARALPPTSNDWPFSFLEYRIIPLPYLWCLYLIGGILLFNGGSDRHSGFSMRATRWFVLGLTSGILLLWCMMRISALAGDIPQTAVQALTAALALSALAMVAVARKVTTPRLITWLFVLIDIAANLWFSQPGKSAMLVITLLAALLLFTLAVAVGLEIQSEDQKEVINVFICGLSCSLLLQNLAIISGISSLLIVCTPLVLAIFCPPLVYKLMARLRPAEVG